MKKQATEIVIEGLIQGVGFRPFIYRQAKKFGIEGWVKNTNENVIIHAEATKLQIENFCQSINRDAPVAAQIKDIYLKKTDFKGFSGFAIYDSENVSGAITQISPDIAVCRDCLLDVKNQFHRINYPLINCTNCGPRFTIIKDLPYDRKNTTMANFELCAECAEEYRDINNRRFHAQPVACNNCGPRYTMHIPEREITGTENIAREAALMIDEGRILCIKGMGGFHLACDAFNNQSISILRQRKKREGKPFAVMFKDIHAMEQYAEINTEEKALVLSWRRPIALLKLKKELATDVCVGFENVGAMLPYMPFHYLLFENLKTNAIVLTSGNFSDEPIYIKNENARKELSPIADGFVTYNREIQNRTDDSVAFVAGAKTRLIRRSRGYVPDPVFLDSDCEGILAAGAELVNCFAIGKRKNAILSQHIGDLKNIETLEFYKESIGLFKRAFRFEPTMVVADLHPDYLSSRYAVELGIPVKKVQHHHAHIASCMAENGIKEKVIGVAFDGTGLGTDGNIWGGEFLVCDLVDFERVAHFEYVPLPGGDQVTKEPWRTAVSFLYKYFGDDIFLLKPDFLENINQDKLQMLVAAINKKINSPLSSSAGRLFDAVSALINLCPVSSFHAESPMRLEAVADPEVEKKYSYQVIKNQVVWKMMFKQILDDLQKGVQPAVISAKFHNAILDVMLELSKKISKERQISKVALSGGSFQNKILLEKSEVLLKQAGFEVFTHSSVPSNDGGIALGQLALGCHQNISDFT